MPTETIIDVAPAAGVCRRCFKECCNCAGCVERKGGERDLCTRCFDAAKKEAAPK